MEELTQEIAQAAAALGAAVLAYLVLWARGVLTDLYRRHILETALDRAAGMALANPEVRAGAEAAVRLAAQHGAAYLRGTIPDTLRRLGVGGALVDMVRGEIGLHLERAGIAPLPPAVAPEAVVIPRTPVLFDPRDP